LKSKQKKSEGELNGIILGLEEGNPALKTEIVTLKKEISGPSANALSLPGCLPFAPSMKQATGKGVWGSC
jgi:hypothetical protein